MLRCNGDDEEDVPATFASTRLSLLVAATTLSLASCQVDLEPPIPERPPAVRPAPPRLECDLGGPARSFEGGSVALASNALVVHDDDGRAWLHRLDEPSEPVALPLPVLAIARRGDTWLVTAPGLVGEIDADGEVLWQAELDVHATDAVMALDSDALWVVLRDDEDEVSVVRVDLRARAAGAARSVGRGRGNLLVSPGRGGFAAGTVWTPDGPIESPGSPVALAADRVFFESDVSTGVWAGDPPVRLTRADVTPAALVATRLGARVVLAYRDGGDIFVQPADLTRGALGEPLLIAADASPAAIAADQQRFWVAWERADTVEVRAGECG